jgi:hypothetical protein
MNDLAARLGFGDRTTRDASVGLAAGLAAGFALACAARIAMRVVAIASGQPVQLTATGTLSILFFVSVTSSPLGVVYLDLRHRLPGPVRLRPLVFGALLLVTVGVLFLTGLPDEFGPAVPARPVRLALFASLFVLEGMAVGAVADRLAAMGAVRAMDSRPIRRGLIAIGIAGTGLLLFALIYTVLAAVAAATAWRGNLTK